MQRGRPERGALGGRISTLHKNGRWPQGCLLRLSISLALEGVLWGSLEGGEDRCPSVWTGTFRGGCHGGSLFTVWTLPLR